MNRLVDVVSVELVREETPDQLRPGRALRPLDELVDVLDVELDVVGGKVHRDPVEGAHDQIGSEIRGESHSSK